MDNYLTKFKATNYGHCIIKEELIIPDSDEDVDVKAVDDAIDQTITNASFSDSFVEAAIDEHNKSDGSVKGHINHKSGRLKNRNVSDQKKKQTKLDLLIKSEDSVNNEQTGNSNDVTNDEKPNETVEAAEPNLDRLFEKLTKAYCNKCKVKSTVIYRKARCSKCDNQLTYNCESCDKSYISFTELGYHLKSRHTGSVYSCTDCNKTFTLKRGLLKHQQKFHESSKCLKCGEMFRYKYRSAHKKVCGKQASHKCDKCPFVAKYKSNLTSHMIEKHSRYEEKCKNCNKVFTNIRSMRRHLRVYCNKSKLFECDHCGHKVYRKDQMVTHLDQLHCKGNLQSNRRKDSNTEDDNTEGGRATRICKYCDLALNRYEHMRYHLERCESAPLKFRPLSVTADQSDLGAALKNLAIAHCSNCKTNKLLKYRVRRCSKCDMIMKYICKSCPAKRFGNMQMLREHMRIEHVKNDVKFYHCDKCRCSYNRKKNLKEHQKHCHSLPSKTANYKCSKCGKDYTNKASFRKHGISCGQEPKFVCDKCPYKTHFKSSLVDHFMAKRSTCI